MLYNSEYTHKYKHLPEIAYISYSHITEHYNKLQFWVISLK